MESSNSKYMEKRASEDLDVIIEQPTSAEDDKAFKLAARGLVFFGQRMWKKSQEEDETIKGSIQGDKDVSSDPIAEIAGDCRSGNGGNDQSFEHALSSNIAEQPRVDQTAEHPLSEQHETLDHRDSAALATNYSESGPNQNPQFHKAAAITQSTQSHQLVSELNLKAKRTRSGGGGGRYGVVANATTRKR